MKQFLFFSIMSCFSLATAIGQKINPDEPVKYEMLKDDVENYKFLSAGVSFLELDLSAPNLSVYGFGVYVQGEVNPNLFLMADYRMSLAERLLHPSDFGTGDAVLASVNDDTRSNRFRAEGTYYLSNKTEKGKVPVAVKYGRELAGRGDGSMQTVQYIIEVDGNINTRYGVRMGFDRGISAYNMSGASQINAIGPGGTFTYDLSGTNEGSTYMNYTFLRLGAARTKMSNVHINTEKFGYKHHSFMRYLYFDVLIALRQELDDVFASRTDLTVFNEFTGEATTPYYQRMNLQDANDFRNLGFAIGYRSPSISGGSEQTVELGFAPGVQGVSGLYLQFGWRFGFGTSQKMKNVPPYGAGSR
jgi:hypothetical protein